MQVGDKIYLIDEEKFDKHTHNYAGSASVGGSANSAVKLDTNTAGSATQPVYFKDGKPVACTYTVEKSVPSDAKFTDTDTWRGIQNNLTSDSTTDSLSAKQGKVLKDSIDMLNSNLDELKVNDVAGGKNLIDVKKVILGDIVEGTVASGNNYITDFIHLEYGKKYILSHCYKHAHETAWFTQDKTYVQRTFGTEITPPTNDCYYVRIEYGVEEGINAQLEEGTTATPYEPYIPSVKMLADEVKAQNDSLEVLGKCKNLLNPTLHTTTQNGVTCTNNGDGTYTLNGTNQQSVVLYIGIGEVEIPNKNLVILGSKNTNVGVYIEGTTPTAYGNKITVVDSDKGVKKSFGLAIKQGATITNEIVKPMLCENLNATYDDFVPYTGDGETLTHDVAGIRNDLGNVEKEIENSIRELQSNFQDGVDSVYNAIVSAGTTPSSKSLPDVVTGIGTLSTNRYNNGKTDYNPTGATLTNAGALTVTNAAGTTRLTKTFSNSYNAGVAATKKGTAGAAQVLTGYTFTNSSSVEAAGTMPNNGAVSASVARNSSYTIPAGYHNGSGKVTGPSMTDKAATTFNTSTSDQTIAAGIYTTGVQTIKAVKTANISAANIKTGVTITVGDENNTSRIASVAGTFTAANTVSSGQTAAAAAQLLTGYSAWVAGAEVKGSMTNQGAKTASLNCGGSYTIPAGYHNGSGKVTANSLASQTSATAAAGDIVSGKTAYVNGTMITGTITSVEGVTF